MEAERRGGLSIADPVPGVFLRRTDAAPHDGKIAQEGSWRCEQ